MFDALAIANGMVARAKAKGIALTPMQLQKLLYFAHGWFLAITDEPLIAQPIEAWQYGPVVDPVYQEFKKFGAEPITETAPAGHRSCGCGLDPTSPYYDQASAILDQVLDTYGRFSGSVLMGMTHAEGSPWSGSYDASHLHKAIDNQVILTHFKQLMTDKKLF